MSQACQLEVCIDNIESLTKAIEGGATRIELCSSLALGGLTPSFGFMQLAAQNSTVPVYAMIRPRQGDFLYNSDELAIMRQDILAAHNAGLNGVVFGMLDKNGHLPEQELLEMMLLVHGLGMQATFHRAIDQCADIKAALNILIKLQFERVLSSGQAASALEGVQQLNKMVTQARGRIAIMAGAGVNGDNVAAIIAQSGVREVHLSGKTTRASQMEYIAAQAHMGDKDQDDWQIPVTSQQAIAAVAQKLN